MMLLAVYLTAGIFFSIAFLMTFTLSKQFVLRLSYLNYLFALLALLLAGFTTGIYWNHDGYFGDFWTATEALNKAHGGLLSSIDFFSPIGPVYYHIYKAITLVDATPTASTVMHAGALAGLLASILAVLMLRQQMSRLGLSIVVFSVVAVAVSGRGNGEMLQDATFHFLAPYNRWGWAFFIPAALRLSLPANKNKLSDIALGLTIALLLMLKVTYGVALLGLLAARTIVFPRTWREIPTILGALITFIGLLELSTGQVTAHLNDLRITAKMPENGLRIQKLFTQIGEASIFSLIAVVTYFATSTKIPTQQISHAYSWPFFKPIIMMLLAAGAGCAVLMQNHYAVEAAIYPLLPLISLEWNSVFHRSSLFEVAQRRVLVTGIVLLMVFYPVVDVGLHFGQRLQYALYGPDPEFTGTPYADLRFEPFLIGDAKSKLNSVADGYAGVLSGLKLLSEAGVDQPRAGRIATLSFANPFPMLLRQPSPIGTPIWLHENRSFSSNVFVEASELFEGVEYILIPPGSSTLQKIYKSTLEVDFEQHSRSKHWVLFVRRKI